MTADRTEGTDRTCRRWVWLLFAAALVVRLVYVLQEYPVPPQDTPDYDEIARNLLQGRGFVHGERWFGVELQAWRSPFYPFFLAAVYGLAGYGHLAVKGVQAVVGAVTVVLVFLLARRIRPGAAAVAGILAVVYGPLVTATNEVMTETWFAFWLVLTTWLLTDGAGSKAAGRGRLLAGGATIGLAALTRPVGLLLWPAFAAVAGWRLRREGVRRALWVGLATAAVLLPWSVRNYQVFGTWVPLATHGGFILARSNSDRPAWREEHGWGVEESFFRQIPSEVERDRYWRQQGLDWIRSHPGRYLWLAGERFLRFWYFLRPDYNFWYILVLPFFAVGLWRYRGDPDLALLTGFIGLSVVVFSLVLYGSTRFRLPLEPFFLVYAAALGREIWDRWGWRRAGLLLGAVLVLNLSCELGDETVRTWVLAVLAQGQLK